MLQYRDVKKLPFQEFKIYQQHFFFLFKIKDFTHVFRQISDQQNLLVWTIFELLPYKLENVIVEACTIVWYPVISHRNGIYSSINI